MGLQRLEKNYVHFDMGNAFQRTFSLVPNKQQVVFNYVQEFHLCVLTYLILACNVVNLQFCVIFTTTITPCGDFRIYLSFRFYVKSTFGESTSSRTVIFCNLRVVIWSISAFKKCIQSKIQNFLISRNYFHVKSK